MDNALSCRACEKSILEVEQQLDRWSGVIEVNGLILLERRQYILYQQDPVKTMFPGIQITSPASVR